MKNSNKMHKDINFANYGSPDQAFKIVQDSALSYASGISFSLSLDEFLKKSTDARTAKTSKTSKQSHYDFKPVNVPFWNKIIDTAKDNNEYQ